MNVYWFDCLTDHQFTLFYFPTPTIPFCSRLSQLYTSHEQDDEIAAFNDINPAAETHILIVPVDHVKSVKTMTTDHIPLLEKMHQKGIDLLKERGHNPEQSRYDTAVFINLGCNGVKKCMLLKRDEIVRATIV